MVELGNTTLKKYPFKHMIWYPTFNYVHNEYYFKFLFLLYHYIPGFFFDIVLQLSGRKLRLTKVYNLMWKNLTVLDYFLRKDYRYDDRVMKSLYDKMSKEDHEVFPVIIDTEGIRYHAEETLDGIRKYFFKETPEDNKIAVKRLEILKNIHYTFLVIFYSVVLYILCKLFL